jgi:hypothetical protein
MRLPRLNVPDWSKVALHLPQDRPIHFSVSRDYGAPRTRFPGQSELVDFFDLRRNDVHDLEAFIAVARTRNFRRAAVEQRVSVSSLSQRLRDLEERLGIRLINRTTRSVALTQAGDLLLARIAPAMSTITDALDQVRGLSAVPSGRLRINAPRAVDLVIATLGVTAAHIEEIN